MTLAHRQTTALAAPSRRGFLKALGAFAAASVAAAALPSVAKAVAAVERKTGVHGIKLPDGTVVTPSDWVSHATYTTLEVKASAAGAMFTYPKTDFHVP